jgi:predicted RNase H-like HicB family nuclease
VPSRPGCIAEGSISEEALTNMRDAIALCSKALSADNEPVPEDID